MKFPSLSSTLSLLKPLTQAESSALKKTRAKNTPERNLYDTLEEIISIYDTQMNGEQILNQFNHLSEIHQHIFIVTLIEHNMVDTLNVILKSSYNINFLIRGHSPLHFAIKNNNLAIVNTLVKSNANLELQNTFKETALNCAVRTENNAIIKYLVEHGANVNTQASDSSSPLTFAVNQGNSEAVSILLQYGAQLDRSHLVKTL